MPTHPTEKHMQAVLAAVNRSLTLLPNIEGGLTGVFRRVQGIAQGTHTTGLTTYELCLMLEGIRVIHHCAASCFDTHDRLDRGYIPNDLLTELHGEESVDSSVEALREIWGDLDAAGGEGDGGDEQGGDEMGESDLDTGGQ